VVLEACAEAFAPAERIKALGHDVRVVAATLVRQLGVGACGIKTDVRDAGFAAARH
jgi:transposase